MKTQYFSYIKKFYSDFSDNSSELISNQLLSPFRVELPNSILRQAQALVKALYALREDSTYQHYVATKSPASAQWNPGNKSLCMSYDFHINAEGKLKLIEINTNAAFLLMGYFLYKAQELPLPIADFSLEELHHNFLEEYDQNQHPREIIGGQLCGKPSDSTPLHQPLTIAIIDESPSQQKLYFEFLLYQKMLQSFGHNVLIADPSELALANSQKLVLKTQADKHIDFIYNRTTDFYLEQEANQALKTSYLNRGFTLSPNPHEYSLLADKERLIEWSLWNENNATTSPPSLSSASLEPLRQQKEHLLEAILLTNETQSSVWANKKKYFMKPLTSFGSKGGYRGEGISRVAFDQLIEKNFLAQEFCPAPEQIFSTESIEPTKLKYDLRFYAYKDRIQLVLARLYQGQLTNLKTLHGGFAPVIFK